MMTQLECLQALAALATSQEATAGRCASCQAIAAHLGVAPQRVADAMHKLRREGVVEPARHRDGRPRRGWYRLTKASQERLAREAAGQGPPHRRTATERQERMWRAMRVQRKFTTASVLAVMHDATSPIDDRVMRNKVSQYLRALHAAGVVVPLGGRSRRDGVWLLVQDLGPLAPALSARGAWDPNAGRMLPTGGAS